VSTKTLLLISVSLTATGLILIRSHLFKSGEGIELINEGQVRIQGMVNEEPRQRGQRLYFNFQGYHITTSIYTKLTHGDIIALDGQSNSKEQIYFPKIEKIGREAGFWVSLSDFRTRIKDKIDSFLPEPQSSLLSGVLLGVDEGLPKDFDSALRKTGTIHVVVVSGYNIGVVGGFFISLSSLLKRRWAIVAALLAIIFYTFLTGAAAPTVRAAIMGGLAFFATALGRQNWPIYALLLSAFIMLLVDPTLVSEISFQLSFMATAGIILFKDYLSNFLKKIPSPFGEDLAVTVSAQALVVPLIFFHFGQVSPISPIVNALILWTIPFVTYIGFGIAFFSFAFEPFARLLSFIAWVPLTIFIWVVEIFSKVPASLIQIPKQNFLVLVSFYLVLGVIIFSLLKYVRIYKSK